MPKTLVAEDSELAHSCAVLQRKHLIPRCPKKQLGFGFLEVLTCPLPSQALSPLHTSGGAASCWVVPLIAPTLPEQTYDLNQPPHPTM